MKLRHKLAAVAALGGAAVQSAHAELPAAITTAITGAQTDMTTLYTSLIGVGAAIWVLRVIYRKFAVR